MKTTSVKTKTKAIKYPRKADDVYVNRKMLYKVRDELRLDISASEHRVRSDIHDLKAEVQGMNSRFVSMDAKFSDIDSRFASLDSRFARIDARFEKIDSRFETIEATLKSMQASSHRLELLVEDQNNRNKIVLDGLSHVLARQERFEDELRLRR
jgi:chromosome segregation ATPase